MKKFLILLLFAASFSSVLAQNSDYEKASQKAISELSPMLGDWKGESWQITQTGKNGPFITEYHTTTKMNGNLIFIESKGTDPQSGDFENLAIITYNVPEKSYKMSGYSAGGEDQVYYFKVLEPNKKIEYGYEVENKGKVRITLTLNDDGKTATQVGEYSTDGQNWIKFREENMTKI